MRHLAVAALLAAAPLLDAQCDETVTLGTLGPGAEYGAAVAVDGDTLVVGAPGVDTVLVQSWNGAGWSTIASFTGQVGSRYGSAVALADGVAIVGAPEHDDLGLVDTGAAQLLVEGPPGTWTAGPVVIHPNPQDGSSFGYDVDTDGVRAVVGAPGQNADKGNVRVYDVSGVTLSLRQGVPPPTVIGTTDVRWGSSVAIDGPSLAVGAPQADPSGLVDAGAACFYRANGAGNYQFNTWWTFGGNLVRFGLGVDVDGDRGVGRGIGNFAAALFVEYDGAGNWDDVTTQFLFDEGDAIALDGARCLAGRPAYVDGLFGPESGGFAYLTYDGAAWSTPWVFMESLAAPTLRLGDAASLAGDRGVLGAPHDATGGADAGAVYTYDTSLVGWQDATASNSQITSSAHGTPLLFVDGSLCGGDPFEILLQSARPSAPATLVVGLSLLDAPFKGGLLGPAPDVLLAGLATDASGELVLPGLWPDGLPNGTQLWMQWFVVDPATPKGLSATPTRVLTTPTPAP